MRVCDFLYRGNKINYRVLAFVWHFSATSVALTWSRYWLKLITDSFPSHASMFKLWERKYATYEHTPGTEYVARAVRTAARRPSSDDSHLVLSRGRRDHRLLPQRTRRRP